MSKIETVTIGNQIWQKSNSEILTFRNGDPIPVVEKDKAWEKAGDKGQPACCFLDNKQENLGISGVIYNWYAINDPRGIAPEGFRLPTVNDWVELAGKLGGKKKILKEGFTKRDTFLGVASKLKSNFGWEDEGDGTDEYGLCIQPFRNRDASGYFSKYDGISASLWTIDETDGGFDKKDKNFAFTAFFASDEDFMSIARLLKGNGAYIRFISEK